MKVNGTELTFEEACELADKWNGQLPKRVAKYAHYEAIKYVWGGAWVALYVDVISNGGWNLYLAYSGVIDRETCNPVGWR